MKILGTILITIAGFFAGLAIFTFVESIQGLISINWSFATDADKALWRTFIATGVVTLSYIGVIIGVFVAKHRLPIIIVASILGIVASTIMLVMEIRAGSITGFTWPIVKKYIAPVVAPVLCFIGWVCFLKGR